MIYASIILFYDGYIYIYIYIDVNKNVIYNLDKLFKKNLL